jgi:hypothetical protein
VAAFPVAAVSLVAEWAAAAAEVGKTNKDGYCYINYSNNHLKYYDV